MPEQFAEEIRFHPTGGRFMGGLAIAAAVGVVVLAFAESGGVPAALVCGAILFAVLAWASMLWPGVSVDADDLVLRTMVEHQRLPLAAIERLAVGQVLAVHVGEKRYVSSAISKPWRKALIARSKDKGAPDEKDIADLPYADFVEHEIRSRMEHAREVRGIALLSEEQLALASGVRRQPAWLPIGLMAAAALGVLVTILV